MSVSWLSVLMPVFNGAATLQATLESLACQADGLEVILVDQGSDDASVAIAEKYLDRMNLRLVSAPQNKNWVQNTNQALKLASAPRACLLHQDDLWRPGRAKLLQRMFAKAPEMALWLHGADYVDDAGKTIGTLSPPFGGRMRQFETPEVLARLIVQNTVALPAAAFPVDAALEIGGLDEALWYTADWDLWLALARRGPTLWSPERAVAFRLHATSLTISGSRDLDDFASQLEAPLKRHQSALADHQRDGIVAQARASNLMNVWLASVFHNERRSLLAVLRAIVTLGPRHWGVFLRNSRVIHRVLPRLRLMRRKVGSGA